MKLPAIILIAALMLWVGVFAGRVYSDPPKWVLSIIDSTFYQDQCASGDFYGIRQGMSRRDVQVAFGVASPDFRTEWYIVDERLGLPPDNLVSPLWRASVLPPYLMEADEWRAFRRGHGPGYELLITFVDDRVVCADARYEILLP